MFGCYPTRWWRSRPCRRWTAGGKIRVRGAFRGGLNRICRCTSRGSWSLVCLRPSLLSWSSHLDQCCGQQNIVTLIHHLEQKRRGRKYFAEAGGLLLLTLVWNCFLFVILCKGGKFLCVGICDCFICYIGYQEVFLMRRVLSYVANY